ncbi:DUF2127 domain-containing protein [Candidatus Kaiserbacteria bacterium]|nr:DUF2127 domain-containing protein [Candidatus Kaiserbacteria bacterium]
MHTLSREQWFILGMWWRMGYGVVRLLLGLAILKLVGTPVLDIIRILMGRELIEDPSDPLFTHIAHALTNHPLYISYFLASYFICWGIIEIVLSYNLIRHRLWAFPVALVATGVFLGYEIFRFFHTHSLILLGVIFVDAVIFWLIYVEYWKLSGQKAA